MNRLLTTMVASAGLALATATPAIAAQPRIYHTITSSHADAVLDRTDGCERTEVFVSSSVAMYAAQPGPVNKQGLTGVFVRVTDACARTTAAAPAAGGGGGTVVFQADGQNRAALVTDNRLRSAQLRTTIAATDANGDPVSIALSATWTATGPLEHTTNHSHDHFDDGNVNATSNELNRPVSATVSVTFAGRSASGEATDATLTQTKSRCIEVPRPGAEEFYPCFGFPG
ncbi:hypothetical protein PZ938_00410 [Luteipulveratus sp. YIM 133132]|uniref:Uncharacterized protein n=1 Tax=Luteipulveratus flavus TaxID=3031728 RepID=A0ABT6C666_9MICO|nr:MULTISPECIES: hypothetical protein [unclassified Luteipulveratus]MDE9364056.1 hypothetical protein [Luteipulveratus sp. YIM 133132]MDF8263559.1 hypothetical protein [Luteipulveratus sp. YIM 133296]